MSGPADKIIDLIYGCWRSQILYAGVELGVFDHLAGNRSNQADSVAAEIGADEKLLYRLMRALASLGLLDEDESRGFVASTRQEELMAEMVAVRSSIERRIEITSMSSVTFGS